MNVCEGTRKLRGLEVIAPVFSQGWNGACFYSEGTPLRFIGRIPGRPCWVGSQEYQTIFFLLTKSSCQDQKDQTFQVILLNYGSEYMGENIIFTIPGISLKVPGSTRKPGLSSPQ